MSIHEEVTVFALRPVMGVFNNLVVFDQHVPQNTLASIVPDLATAWSWSEDGTQLTFPLQSGVKWHDGKPFTAQDLKCTWEALLGLSADKFRINPRRAWYRNIERITTDGDYEVTFHLILNMARAALVLGGQQSSRRSRGGNCRHCQHPLRDSPRCSGAEPSAIWFSGP